MATTAQPRKAVAVAVAAPTPKIRVSRHITLALGLATFKVGIAPMNKKREGGGSYVCKKHGCKVNQRWYCSGGDHIIVKKDGGEESYMPDKGYRYDDQYIVLDEEMLDALVIPKQDTLAFDSWDDELDPVWVEKTYLLQPDDDGAARTLDALGAAMIKHKFVLFGDCCLHTTTHVFALKWSRDLGCVVLHQLHLGAHMKMAEAAALSTAAAGRTQPATKIVTEVKRVKDALLDKGPVLDVPDYAKDAIQRAVEEIATGGLSEELRKKPAEESGDVPDLMAALKQSVTEAQARKKPTTKRPATAGGKGKA